jgi:hypothetical protein
LAKSGRLAPGHPARHDYEYRRNGTANVFVAVDAHRPRRYTKVTGRRTAVDSLRGELPPLPRSLFIRRTVTRSPMSMSSNFAGFEQTRVGSSRRRDAVGVLTSREITGQKKSCVKTA